MFSLASDETIRKKIIDLLLKWKGGTIDELDVYMEGENLYEQHLDEKFGTGCDSIEKEVLNLLDELIHASITVDDVPAIIKFLQTPRGEETRGFAEWKAYWDNIDYDERAPNYVKYMSD